MSGLSLARGTPIRATFFDVYPFTLAQMEELGTKYNEYCFLLASEADDFITWDSPLGEEEEFSLFTLLMKEENSLQQKFLEALCYATKKQFQCNFGVFFLEGHVLLREDLTKLREIVRLQNSIVRQKRLNPADAKAKEIADKLAATRKEVERIKSKSQEALPIEQLIIRLVMKSQGSLTFESVWELTHYQFKEALKAAQLIENYDTQIKQLLAGAKIGKNEIRHWTEGDRT